MVRVERCVGLSAAVLAVIGMVAGCGDDGGPSKGGSFANIQSSISSPTGTVSADTAADVGEAFGEIAAGGTPAFGMRRDVLGQSQTEELPCGSSGSISISASGNESSGSGRVSFNNCCETAGCCMNGGANVYYSSSGAAAEDVESFSYCAEYDVQYSCEGENASIDYAACFSLDGWVYVIEVNGDSYAVSGSYSGGSGTLTITGENGTWTCTYSGDGGSCTGEGETFTF